MSPSALELHWWWRTRGQSALNQLLNKSVRAGKVSPGEPPNVLQSVLDEFAYDADLQDDFLDTLPAIRQRLDPHDMSMPTTSLSMVRCQIFRREALGGINYSRVPEGLSIIDQVEEYRIQVVESTLIYAQREPNLAPKVAVLKALNNASRLHYVQCYMAFRIHVCFIHWS